MFGIAALLGIGGLALFDSLDPLTFIIIFKIFSEERPLAKFIAFIVPYFVIYVLFGVVLLFFITEIEAHFSALDSAILDYIIWAVGLGLIAYGIYILLKGENKKKEEKRELKAKKNIPPEGSGILKYFILGVLWILACLPFAIPYFIVILKVLSAGMSMLDNIAVVILYSSIFVLPYIVTFLALYRYKSNTQKRIKRLMDFIQNRYLLSSILIIFGIIVIYL